MLSAHSSRLDFAVTDKFLSRDPEEEMSKVPAYFVHHDRVAAWFNSATCALSVTAGVSAV